MTTFAARNHALQQFEVCVVDVVYFQAWASMGILLEIRVQTMPVQSRSSLQNISILIHVFITGGAGDISHQMYEYKVQPRWKLWDAKYYPLVLFPVSNFFKYPTVFIASVIGISFSGFEITSFSINLESNATICTSTQNFCSRTGNDSTILTVLKVRLTQLCSQSPKPIWIRKLGNGIKYYKFKN